MIMRLGFDEVYVIAKNENTLWCQALYDIDTARDIVTNLKNNGENKARVITLEHAFDNGYLSG